MKVYINMKTPDALDYAIQDAVSGLDKENKETYTEAIKKIASKWFSYGEMVTLVIDTDKETCEVVE